MKKKVVSAIAYEEHGELHKDQYENYSTTVTFDDQSWGIYAHKEMPNELFIPGQEAEYDIKQQPGQSYMRLSKPKTGGGYGGGPGRGWVPKSPGEIKRDAVPFSVKAVVDLIIAGKAQMTKEDFKEKLSIIQGAVNEEIDNIKD